ncbi:MAG: class II fructose-bisphosphate aldolase [Clostridia bacterium]|nr:class II fructose-bisphosphate aldolase [Clostridia bacterium]
MLASLKEVCNIANEKNVAVGSFNTPNLECLLAVLEAAEELDVPVIIAHAQCHEDVAPLDSIGRVMVELARASKVKVCVHLDHGEDLEYCKRAIDLGFTSIMIDNSTLPYEENIKLTREAVLYAHAHGVDVEAELGRLPSREGGVGGEVATERPEDLYTDVNLVNDFIDRTDVDALAIAFGTAHGFYKTKPVLNFDVISETRKRTDIPLVMHGGSGISHEEYREVISRGIRKINYYSYMSYAGFAAAKAVTAAKESDFYHNLALDVKNAMKQNAIDTLRVFSKLDG